MKQNEFKKLLFKSAVCVMACDGEIHDDEIKEIEIISNKTQYFKALDCNSELKTILDDIKDNGRKVIFNYLDSLSTLDLNTVQELLLLEVIMRIISADKKVDENEVRFLKLVKAKLKVHDELIKERFGVVDYLFDSHYKDVKNAPEKDFFDVGDFPQLANLKDIKVEIKNKKD